MEPRPSQGQLLSAPASGRSPGIVGLGLPDHLIFQGRLDISTSPAFRADEHRAHRAASLRPPFLLQPVVSRAPLIPRLEAKPASLRASRVPCHRSRLGLSFRGRERGPQPVASAGRPLPRHGSSCPPPPAPRTRWAVDSSAAGRPPRCPPSSGSVVLPPRPPPCRRQLLSAPETPQLFPPSCLARAVSFPWCLRRWPRGRPPPRASRRSCEASAGPPPPPVSSA